MMPFYASALHDSQTLSNLGWKTVSNREVYFTEGNIKFSIHFLKFLFKYMYMYINDHYMLAQRYMYEFYALVEWEAAVFAG